MAFLKTRKLQTLIGTILMLCEFAEIIVRGAGGIWLVKEKINTLAVGSFKRKIMILLYDMCLKNMGGYVGLTAKISSPPCLPHGLKGIFISGRSSIGDNCVIFQNVTIGSNLIPTSKTCGSPTIGNSCYIGAGAAIIGNVTIGDNCRVAANSSIFFDMKDNCIALSNCARIIIAKDDNNRYYKWSKMGPIYYDNGIWILEKDDVVINSLIGKL